jgi:polyisoprenoid-binding protein YceI
MKSILSIIVIMFLSQTCIAAIELKTNKSAGQIEFEATGRPSMIKIKGQGEGATSKFILDGNQLKGVVIFNLNSLKTGIELRDQHMKEKYLKTKSNPTALMKIPPFNLPVGWSLQNADLKNLAFNAILKLNGVEKTVQGQLSIAGAPLSSQAEFEIKLSDFQIEIPEYLGVKVADTVKVKVTLSNIETVK